eukprot:gb/GECG01015646.1/.p1 GENE.gb/GECG01015646.1/~~gb/GECG01015646.1/.p1  ORF type:complete len:165 (+),score=15.32 gb/GECG01015646.1/:1-495(+)
MTGGKNLFDIIMRRANMGVGSHVTRKRWLKYPGTHWVITNVQPYARSANRAKVRGVFKFRHWLREPKISRIRSQLKREWVLLYDAETNEFHRSAIPKEYAQEWEEQYFQHNELFEYPPIVPTKEEKHEAKRAAALPKQRPDTQFAAYSNSPEDQATTTEANEQR